MKLIPRLKPYYDLRELFAALRLSRGAVGEYEKKFAAKFGCRYGIFFPYGRSGLYALLKVWGLNNAEVICPAYTCVVVPHAIVLSGNIPVFVDSAEDSFNMSYEKLEEAFSQKTRAVVVTHLFGCPMDISRVRKIVETAEKKYGHKIYVIQDAAHSFGASWKGELVTAQGDAALFGLNISKIINSVFGGMITTNDLKTHDELEQYRQNYFKRSAFSKTVKRFFYLLSVYPAFNPFIYGFVNWLERKGILDAFVRYYDETKIDFPPDWDVGPCELEARVGLVQLNKYDEIIAKKVILAKEYFERFKDDNRISFPACPHGSTHSHVVGLVEDRQAWLDEYFKKGMQLGQLIEYAVPYMPVYHQYKKGEYPRALYYSQHTLNFPNWPKK